MHCLLLFRSWDIYILTKSDEKLCILSKVKTNNNIMDKNVFFRKCFGGLAEDKSLIWNLMAGDPRPSPGTLVSNPASELAVAPIAEFWSKFLSAAGMSTFRISEMSMHYASVR